MKKSIFILSVAVATLFSSCKKDNPEPEPTNTTTNPPASTCQIDMAKFKDFQWHCTNTALANLTFYSNGDYFENSTNDGQWSLSNNCDSVFVTRPSNSFYYKIKSVTTDSLKLINPVFGELTYYK